MTLCKQSVCPRNHPFCISYFIFLYTPKKFLLSKDNVVLFAHYPKPETEKRPRNEKKAQEMLAKNGVAVIPTTSIFESSHGNNDSYHN